MLWRGVETRLIASLHNVCLKSVRNFAVVSKKTDWCMCVDEVFHSEQS